MTHKGLILLFLFGIPFDSRADDLEAMARECDRQRARDPNPMVVHVPPGCIVNRDHSELREKVESGSACTINLGWFGGDNNGVTLGTIRSPSIDGAPARVIRFHEIEWMARMVCGEARGANPAHQRAVLWTAVKRANYLPYYRDRELDVALRAFSQPINSAWAGEASLCQGIYRDTEACTPERRARRDRLIEADFRSIESFDRACGALRELVVHFALGRVADPLPLSVNFASFSNHHCPDGESLMENLGDAVTDRQKAFFCTPSHRPTRAQATIDPPAWLLCVNNAPLVGATVSSAIQHIKAFRPNSSDRQCPP